MKPITSSLIALFDTRNYMMCGLYAFDLVGGSSLYYASADVNIYLNSSQSGGNTYWANQLFVANDALFDKKDNRARLESTVGTQVSTLTFDVIPASATISGTSFLSFIRQGGFDGAELTYLGAYWAYSSSGYSRPLVPVGTITKFVGRVADVNISANLATFTVNSDLELLDIRMPRNLYQASCLNSLYDAGCTLAQSSFTVAAVATVSSTSSRVYVSSLGTTSSYSLGQITFTSGTLNGTSRTVQEYVISSTSSGAYLVVVPPFPSNPSSGDAFTVSKGCDKTAGTCSSVFNNLTHFRGFPYLPDPSTAI